MRVFFNRLFVLCAPLLLLFATACVKSKANLLIKKYPAVALKQDANILRQVILQMHPAVGIYNSRGYYENTFSNFVSGIKDSMTLKEFRLQMKLAIDELHCGHTDVLYPAKFYRQVKSVKLNYSPYVFLTIKDKAFFIANISKKQDSVLKKGMQVISINGVAVDSMIRYCGRFVTSDGFSASGKDHFVQLAFNSYYPSLFGRPDTFKIEYLDGKSKKNLSYAAVQLKNMPLLPLGQKDDSLFKRYRAAKIYFRYLDSTENTLVLRIKKFSHHGDARAYRRIFRNAKKNRTKNLVIDLRNNGGGSLANSYRLLSYLIDTAAPQTLRTNIKNYPLRKYTRGNLAFRFTRFFYAAIGTKHSVKDTDFFEYMIKPRKKNHFDGKVFVLMNGGSFSASTLVSAYLRQNKRAVFIGEESGGTQEGCNAGVTPFYSLPNTGLKVRVPAFRVMHDALPELTGRGVMPDSKVEYYFRDIVSRRDLEMEKVKEMLKSQ